MVRVPGSSGDFGYHRESSTEDVKIKLEPGIEASAVSGSPLMSSNESGSTERQSAGRSSAGVKEEGPAMDPEEKPRPPPQVPSGTPADHAAKRDPPDESPSTNIDGPSPTTTHPPSRTAKKKSKPKASRKKLKAPDSDADDGGLPPTDGQLTWTFLCKELEDFLANDPVMKIIRPKLITDLCGPVSSPTEMTNKLEAAKLVMMTLKEAGLVPGAFDANELFNLGLKEIKEAASTLVEKLAPLVGVAAPGEIAKMEQMRNHEYQTGSSQYASVTSEVDSGSSIDMQRMTLGPSGTAMLQDRKRDARPTRAMNSPPLSVNLVPGTHGPDRMQDFFDAAMERFLKEQRAAGSVPTPDRSKTPGTQDVEMESIGSHHDPSDEYDPDDLSLDTPRPAAMATAEALTGSASMVPRIRVSAISELKEFAGKDNDEDRARSWLNKVKSAYVRDQAPDKEKCLVFGDLLTGPARNWYQQLSRSTRSDWTQLLEKFQTQYCGRGVSFAKQYYHARKRSDESPLEYLHRLIVAGLRAKLPVKDGPLAMRREHVEHFIETLDDRDLADQLALLRLTDAEDLEETLRARQRTKARQGRAAAGSNKFRQKTPPTAPAAPTKPTRAVRAIRTTNDSSGSESESSGSESEAEVAQVYLVAATNGVNLGDARANSPDNPGSAAGPPNAISHAGQTGLPAKRCSHCGSPKHGDLGCWKRLTCQKCGRKGHPSDQCLFVCRACGELHETGKCPMEEFYNLIRMWYNPSKHAGMLPTNAEKMLN